MAAQQQQQPPLIVMAAMPEVGHTLPLLQIARHLAAAPRSLQVFFVGGPQFEAHIRATGAAYHECPNFVTRELGLRLRAVADRRARHVFAVKHIFADSMPTRQAALARCLEHVRATHPGRSVVVINEIMFLGTLPYLFGAPPPKGYDRFPGVINFHTSIVPTNSPEVPPFLANLDYDPSPEGQERNRRVYAEQEPGHKEIQAHASQVIKSLGGTRDLDEEFFSTCMTSGEVTLLPYSRSLEYPRSNMPEMFQFSGGMPLKAIDPTFIYPDWWGEISANAELPREDSSRKRIIFVTQGTVNNTPDQLIQPALRGLADRPDTIVVATLGKRGAAIPDDLEVPANAKVIDYLPYDAILQHADVFVFNGGFGGYMHGIMQGVPMVMAGMSEDKAEVSMRAEWAGVAVNLRTSTPTKEAVREGVEKVLSDGKFKTRVEEIREENIALDFMQHVDDWIDRLA